MFSFVQLHTIFITGFTLAVLALSVAPTTVTADQSADLEKDSQQYLFIDDGIQTNLDIESSFTFEVNLKFESLTGLGDNGDHTIVSKFDGAHGESAYWFFWRKSNETLRLLVDDSGFGGPGTEVGVPWVPELNVWYHVSVIWDDVTNEARFYVNGEQLGLTQPLIQSGIKDSSEPFIIGMYNNKTFCCSLPTSFFDGQIDEVRVWSAVRTPEEIVENMNAVLTGEEVGLEAYWRFEGNYQDETPNGNHLTPVNNPQFLSGVDVEEPEEPTLTFAELLTELRNFINTEITNAAIRNSYNAHAKKLEEFYAAGRMSALMNQLGALQTKMEKDSAAGKITPELSNSLLGLIEALQETLSSENDVPLMTQVVSPYPPESSEWADDVFASGGPFWCGGTIADCGCAITSMAMLSQYRGVAEGLDGENIDPGSLNQWLIENDGYSAGEGSIIWPRALQYFSSKLGFSQFALDHHNATDETLISEYVERGDLAVAYNNRKGHYFLLTDTLADGGYAINDPAW